MKNAQKDAMRTVIEMMSSVGMVDITTPVNLEKEVKLRKGDSEIFSLLNARPYVGLSSLVAQLSRSEIKDIVKMSELTDGVKVLQVIKRVNAFFVQDVLTDKAYHSYAYIPVFPEGTKTIRISAVHLHKIDMAEYLTILRTKSATKRVSLERAMIEADKAYENYQAKLNIVKELQAELPQVKSA